MSLFWRGWQVGGDQQFSADARPRQQPDSEGGARQGQGPAEKWLLQFVILILYCNFLFYFIKFIKSLL